jgi:glutamate racemase
LHKYLTYPDFEDIDALLLACTHYPLIKNEIEQFYDRKVKVFDSVDEVAKKVELELNRYDLLNVSSFQPKDLFFVSDYTLSFEQTTKIFYKQQVQLEIAKL